MEYELFLLLILSVLVNILLIIEKPTKSKQILELKHSVETLATKLQKPTDNGKADFYKEKYNKLLDGICFSAKRNQCGDTFSIKVDLKCQWDIECKKCKRIKELESKVKALEIELEGVI